jgi:hypothetical protein
MTTDFRFRAMCSEILTLLDLYEDGERVDWDAWRDRARALQAQPVAEGPTDDELYELWEREGYEGDFQDCRRFYRGAIAHWGRPMPQPPANGEVAELVEWLTTLRDHDLRHVAPYSHPSIAHWHDFLTRAADLLEHPTPQPVTVSERLPGDALSWWYEPDEDDDEGYGGKWTLLRIRGATYTYTHWLPANALPTPEATNE